MAIFNGGYPAAYPQYYPQMQGTQMSLANQQQAQQPVNTGIIWVQGEAGAKSYLVAPNNTVQLWDSENQVIYLKSADAAGMPSMKILDYKIRDAATQASAAQPSKTPVMEYVTREELDAFERKIKDQINALKGGAEDDK